MGKHINQFGLTFIELILVVSILLILALMTPTFYSKFALQNATSNTIDQLVGSLRKAQVYSMVSRQSDSWSVHIDTSNITLYKGNNFSTRNSGFDEKFAISSNVSITNLTDINFARMTGIPNIISSQTVTISSTNSSGSITINTQGVVIRN